MRGPAVCGILPLGTDAGALIRGAEAVAMDGWHAKTPTRDADFANEIAPGAQ